MKQKIIVLLVYFFFLIPNAAKAQNNYDYLIITPDVFLQGATWNTTLVNLLTSRGFTPKLISVSTSTTNTQIKNIIESYYNTNPLKYVLLIGNGKNTATTPPPANNVSYQYQQHGTVNTSVAEQAGTYIPFFSVHSTTYWNPDGVDVATDDPYVSSLTSHGPVYIGRVPAASIQEVENYVTKLEMYHENNTDYSLYSDKELILNLDVTHPGNLCTGSLVQTLNTSLLQHIPGNVTATQLNVSEHYNGNADANDEGAFGYSTTRENLFKNSINSGVSIITLLGTIGGPLNLGGWYWSDRSSFDLTNINTSLPFLIALNCAQGEVNNPTIESAMRKLLVMPNGGIIGSMAPTENSEQHANGYLLNRFHDLVYQSEVLSYGEIFRILKVELENNYTDLPYFYNSFTYFGDPSIIPLQKTFSISGNVSNNGSPLEGVTITYTGGSTTTDASGNYMFQANYNWSGTITPSKTGYTFSPANISLSNVTTDRQNNNFSGTLLTYTVSGKVTENGIGLAGVNMNYTGGSVSTDSSGNYSFEINYGWSGAITPSKTNYNFTPANIALSNVTSNQTNKNFTATPQFVNISGKVTDGGVPLQGVAITYTGGSDTTDSNGGYSFTVNHGWSGAVTPTKTGYSFMPNDSTLSNVTANKGNIDFTGTLLSHTISGKVTEGGTPLQGVAITYTGGSDTTDSNGDYSFIVNHGWSGTITPTKTGYSFTPNDTTLTNVTANKGNINFSSTLLNYTISGKVTVSGVPLQGVAINYIGGNDTTDSNGDYSFMVSHGWSATVTPTKLGYSFTPTDTTLSNVTANKGDINFTGTLLNYTISGKVTESGTPLQGVAINYTGGSDTTDSNGDYFFTVNHGWSGTVTPSKNGYTFAPTDTTLSNVTANKTNINFTGSLLNYTISGKVTESGTPLQGVAINYTGGSDTTDSNGDYSFSVHHGWSGSIMPNKLRYLFYPADTTLSNVTTDKSNIDFSTSYYYWVQGYITDSLSGIGLDSVAVIYNNNYEDAVFTDSIGHFSFKVSSGWQGVVEPSKYGYTFSPNYILLDSIYSDTNIANINAITNTYTISGIAKFYPGSGSFPFEGIEIIYTPGDTVYSDSTGYYSFPVKYGESVVITAGDGYYFSEDSLFLNNVLDDINGYNIQCTRITKKISGNINNEGIPVEGVNVVFTWGSSASTSVYTNEDGNYMLEIDYDLSGDLILYKAGYSFTPSSKAYNNIEQNFFNQDFLASIVIPDFIFTQKLTGVSGDILFGGTVKISDNFAFTVGYENSINFLYIYEQIDYNWVQKQKIELSNSYISKASIDISGNHAIIGIPGENTYTGSAFIFYYDGTNWIQESKITAYDGVAYDNFGKSVAIEGDYAFAGSETSNTQGISKSGAVYVYKKSGSSWYPHGSKIFANDLHDGQYFGSSIAIQNEVLVVGAHGDNNFKGAGYIYSKNNVSDYWELEKKIVASDGNQYRIFGNSVDIDENTILVGAYFDYHNGYTSGSAYIFKYENNDWIEKSKFAPENPINYEYFGCSVSLDNNLAVIGAYGNKLQGDNSGIAYLFEYKNNIWSQRNILGVDECGENSSFGQSVSLNGENIIIGTGVKKAFIFSNSILAKQNQSYVQAEEIPREFFLSQNYPNPFNPKTLIHYALPVKSDVKISVYDITGRLIKTFTNNSQSAGYQNVEWNSTNNNGIKVASGVYIYRMEAIPLEGKTEPFIQTRKMILLK